jgi:hypothetical protein
MPSKLQDEASTEAVQRDALRRFKADVFQVLAHPTRIHIIECLRDGEITVSGIIQQVAIEQPMLRNTLPCFGRKDLS